MAIDNDVLFHFHQYDWQGEEGIFLDLLKGMDKLLDKSKEFIEKDEHKGCSLENGDVVMPEGITTILEKAREMMLIGITSSYGGEVPIMVSALWYDMLAAVHPTAQLTQMLTDDAIEILDLLAPDDIKDNYIPKMIEDGWLGGMVMTEPNAGSDLGAIKVTATEQEDGTYHLNGEKIFITTPNAEVMIVLARDEDTAADTTGTTKGLSMYLCPKILEDGSRNSYKIPTLETKMGIKSSPTGSLFFDNAEAYIIGEKGKGMSQFFNLMNFARVGISCQSLGIAQAAFDYALAYADGDGTAREQFGRKISEFPAVKSILVDMKLNIEATRSLVYAAAAAMDKKKSLESDSEELQAHIAKTYTLVCLAKYFAPKLGERVTSDAVQLCGGTGYMEEYPVARHFRDMKITDIYEGTGQIQAIKVSSDVLRGRFDSELDEIGEFIEGRDDTASELLRTEYTSFRNAVTNLAAADRSMQALHQETLATQLAKIYSCYLLIQQSDSSERKGIVADLYASKMFQDPNDRMSTGDDTLISHFEEIMYS